MDQAPNHASQAVVAQGDEQEAIGAKLGVPVQSIRPERVMEHSSSIGAFFSIDKAASSAKTRDLVGWKPTEIGLIQNLE